MADHKLDLSEESVTHVEAAAAVYRKAVELADKRRVRIEELEQESKLLTLEIDRLRIDVHDYKSLAEVAEKKMHATRECLVAFETLVAGIARVMSDFVPPMRPISAHLQVPDKDGPDVNPVDDHHRLKEILSRVGNGRSKLD